jgi:uncharacterized protein involved in exopolysaccharide biosynthesis
VGELEPLRSTERWGSELEEDLDGIRDEAQSIIEGLGSQVETLKSRNEELLGELESLRSTERRGS